MKLLTRKQFVATRRKATKPHHKKKKVQHYFSYGDGSHSIRIFKDKNGDPIAYVCEDVEYGGTVECGDLSKVEAVLYQNYVISSTPKDPMVTTTIIVEDY